MLLKALKYSLAFTLISFIPFEVCYLARTFRLTFDKVPNRTRGNDEAEVIEAIQNCLNQT
ncbi:MAG: hypothetical protein ACTS6G_00710 [Candidatus Hodgkinia cicadicola]